MNNFIEKYFNLMDEGVEYDINKYLANGWYIHYNGITCIILRKNIEEAAK